VRPRLLDRKGQVYEPAISPRLKYLLALIFLGFALLGATGAYMAAITLLNTIKAPKVYTNFFYLCVVLVHVFFGFLLVAPFFIFGLIHWSSARFRRNRRAVRLGLALFASGAVVCLSGLALMQVFDRFQLPKNSPGRMIAYWLHVGSPFVAVALYVLHRRAGPDIQWKWGLGWGVCVTGFLIAMVSLHSLDPRHWYQKAPAEGEKYFHPSATRTVGGKFVSARTFMMDEYCKKCHEDIYNDHLHSAHKFSSFNNPAYLFSVRETRKVAGVRAARWCAGCHDQVPFFTGAFDKEDFDDVNDPTAHAGITCTVCHAMTHVNSTKGNGDYVIEEPQHYPFAFSKNPILQWMNNQLVKAKPDFHKQTFLKPFHKDPKFCSTCHKVSLPVELNQYREFLRGQNHHDSFMLSGAGHGARSFYYPPKASGNCATCHMPLKESKDFGAKDFDDSGTRKVHNHFFPAANTGLPWLLSRQSQRSPDEVQAFRKAARENAEFLKKNQLRIDLFGIKEGGSIDGKLTKLRPDLPVLKPGQTYLVEVVIRTLGLGHPFTQGTADSNEVWVDFQARQGPTPIGRNGGMVDRKGLRGEQRLEGQPFVLDDRPVDKESHFINVLMLDRHGNRINRRNPQDIFTPLYNHQIPPGAGQVVHYLLNVPKKSDEDASRREPITLKVRLRYRKFDYEYMSLVHGDIQTVSLPFGVEVKMPGPKAQPVPPLPVVDLCADEVTLSVEGGQAVARQESPIKPAWQRWNDYGIGCLLEGGAGNKQGELRQAEEAFRTVIASADKAAKVHGYLNLARVLLDSTREEFTFTVLGITLTLPSSLVEAGQTLEKAGEADPKAQWWTRAWLNARVNVQNGQLAEAVRDLEKIVDPRYQPRQRKFDFTKDYLILNELADAYYELAKLHSDDRARRDDLLRRAVKYYERTLEQDAEDLSAHFGLAKCYSQLGDKLPMLGKVPASLAVPETSEKVREELGRLGKQLTDADLPAERRVELALQLGELIGAVGQRTYKTATRRPGFDDLRQQLAEAYRKTKDEETRSALAYVLGYVHRELHKVYKPDDLAAARARQLYRSRPENKAADRASQAIVIYPLHRP
jgi:hypothetical protein